MSISRAFNKHCATNTHTQSSSSSSSTNSTASTTTTTTTTDMLNQGDRLYLKYVNIDLCWELLKFWWDRTGTV